MLAVFVSLLVLAVPDPLAALGPVPPGAVRVYLIRHGQALSNLQPPPAGGPRALDHLTSLGQAQARKVGEALAGQGVRLVLTSPARRARETAEGIAAALGRVPVRVDPRLSPLELGRGRSGRRLRWEDRSAEWKAGRDPAPRDGESMAQVGERVMAAVKGVRAGAPGSSVAMVAHAEVIAAFIGQVEGTPPAQRFPPRLANGSFAVVEVLPDGGVALRLSNHVPPGMPSPPP